MPQVYVNLQAGCVGTNRPVALRQAMFVDFGMAEQPCIGTYRPVALRQAMFVDFGMAEQYGGDCYLRYDDTNPEAEKLEFIEHIQDIVAWLGWKPAKACTN